MTEYASLVISVDSRQTATATTALQALEKQGAQTERATDALALAAKRLMQGLAAVYAGAKIEEITKLASRYNELGLAMDVVGSNAGYSTQELDAQEQSLRRTGISMIESRANITKMVQANIDLAHATKLARLAQDAAVIGNLNSSEAFGTLIHGIQSAQTDVLRTIGINVNFDNSYKQLARTLGKNADELTENEKMQARVNAVLGQAPAIAGAYEAAMGNAGKQLRSASRYLEDFEVKLGQSTQVPFSSAVEAYADSLKFLSEHVDEVVQVLETGLYVAIGRGITASGQYVAQLAREVIARKEAAIAATEQAMAEKALAAAQTQSGLISQATAAERIAAAEATIAANARAAAGGLGIVAGAGSRLLGLMGGPVGLAVTVGAVALSLVDFTPKASAATESTDEFAEKIAKLTGNMKELKALQIDNDLEAIKKEIESTTQAITDRINEAQRSNAKLGQADNQFIQEMQGRLAKLGQAYQEVQQKKNALLDSNKAASGQDEQTVSDKVLNDYKRRLDSLREQISTFGATTEAAKILYETEQGELKSLSPQQKQNLLNLAKELDAKRQLTDQVQYMGALEDQLAAKRNQANASVLGIGMGEQARKDLEELIQVQQEYALRREQLARQQQTQNALPDGIYQQRIQALRNAEEEEVRIVTDAQRRQEQARHEGFNGATRAWHNYLESARDISGQMEGLFSHAFTNLEDSIVEFVKTGKLNFRNLMAGIADDVIHMLVKIAIQMAANAVMTKSMGTAAAAGYVAQISGQAGAQVAMAGLNALASTAAIPVVGPAAAPGAAAAAMAAAAPLAGSAIAAASSSLAGMAHSGIDSIPSEGTWLLDRGERVLSHRQNKDLTEYLGSQRKGMGSNITIVNQTSGKIDRVEERRGANGDRVLIIQEALDAVAASLRDPNSRVSRSMKSSFNTQRNR